jgi:hypothetical protein
MSKWEIGARAVIVISEHYENHNRIVTLQQRFLYENGACGWAVHDGHLFKGYGQDEFGQTHRDKIIYHELLGIEQWKLRLFEDGDDIVIRDDMEYVKHE